MCDYSLMHVQSRAAKVGDRLVTKNFGTGTRGFASIDDLETAVCLLPGTEIAFDQQVHVYGDNACKNFPPTARFRQINKSQAHVHHDALDFSDGSCILLTYMEEGQMATVLQLPAPPLTKKEAEAQSRVEVVA